LRPAAAALATVLALLALLPAGASAAAASLPDIEDEVMCTICGTTLQLSSSPQAERERAFINELIAQGKDKEEIKQALVAEYGENVLAVPEASGFGLAAFIVPIAGVLIALVAVGLAARRWRRARDSAPATQSDPVTEASAAEAERLDSDLGRYHL
jgi:cytochrome c-type biogenesis protein CcmH